MFFICMYLRERGRKNLHGWGGGGAGVFFFKCLIFYACLGGFISWFALTSGGSQAGRHEKSLERNKNIIEKECIRSLQYFFYYFFSFLFSLLLSVQYILSLFLSVSVSSTHTLSLSLSRSLSFSLSFFVLKNLRLFEAFLQINSQDIHLTS